MNKIGFRFSWEKQAKRPRAKGSSEELPSIVPGTAVGHLIDVQMRIDEHERIIMSSAFNRLSKKKRADLLVSYRFLITTLALIQPASLPTVTEFSGLSMDEE